MISVIADEPLAPRTSLGLGGAAAHFVEACTRKELLDALAFAEDRALPVRILGGGSNLVIADAGVPGLVIQVATRGVELARAGGCATLTVQAGEPWDALVERSVDEGLAGLECMTGIPGLTGATPIQNVGAYGQEVAQVIEAVEVLDRAGGRISWLPASACEFGYRDSRFKRTPERFVVLAVRFRLATSGTSCVRYSELARVLAPRGAHPSLREVKDAVRALRASKGMLMGAPEWEPSAGSFFTNPIVSAQEALAIAQRAVELGAVAEAGELPQHHLEPERVKLSAAWLIERAGVQKGTVRDGVGVSARHALALVHRGGGSSRALLALAEDIARRVERAFGVRLEIEPVRW